MIMTDEDQPCQKVEDEKWYFGHSKLDFDTELEGAIRSDLEEQMAIICPNRDIDSTATMEYHNKILLECTGLIVLEHDGFIGRGVFSQVGTMLKANKSVKVYRDGILYKVVSIIMNDPNDWRCQYGRLILEDQKND